MLVRVHDRQPAAKSGVPVVGTSHKFQLPNQEINSAGYRRGQRSGDFKMLERRQVLKIIIAGTTTSLVPAGILAATLRETESSGTGSSLRGQLETLVGSRFRLTGSDGVVRTARLIAVDDGPVCPGLEQFSILFEGTDLAEGLHEVYHWQTGSELISLVPSGEPGSGMTRQRAHFSRFV
jgi:hypothetical protein